MLRLYHECDLVKSASFFWFDIKLKMDGWIVGGIAFPYMLSTELIDFYGRRSLVKTTI